MKFRIEVNLPADTDPSDLLDAVIEQYNDEDASVEALEEVETATCIHCGHGIAWDSQEGWVAPDAGTDREFGDGIWRDSCPDNDTHPNPEHEPEGYSDEKER